MLVQLPVSQLLFHQATLATPCYQVEFTYVGVGLPTMISFIEQHVQMYAHSCPAANLLAGTDSQPRSAQAKVCTLPLFGKTMT